MAEQDNEQPKTTVIDIPEAVGVFDKLNAIGQRIAREIEGICLQGL